MANNDKKELEHPKAIMEVMDNTLSSITGYASAKGISTLEATQVLILNELRCIHWHFDTTMPREEEVKKK